MHCKLTGVVANSHGQPLRVPEISFSPAGDRMAVSYGHARLRDGEEANSGKVIIYDSASLEPVDVIVNKDVQHDFPHGVLLLDDYLIVAYKIKRAPSYFHVYGKCESGYRLISAYRPPYSHLHEIHSLAIIRDILAVTFCENRAETGAVGTFRFNFETGEITGPISLEETFFAGLGDPKGVSFDAGGDRLFVTFESDKDSGLQNGIAILPVSEAGEIHPKGGELRLRDDFCRLENISVVDNLCAVADTINNRVSLYDLSADPGLVRPLQEIRLPDSHPHGVKLSPDKTRLVVSGLGHFVEDQEIRWDTWLDPRGDNLYIYDRADGIN